MRLLSKSGLAAAAFAIVAFALPVQAGEWERERDPASGLFKEPDCRMGYSIKGDLKMLKQDPTGHKASNSKWDMEIYSNAQTNGWTLVGKSKAPEAASSSKLCRLASGRQTPYEKEKWYAQDFAKPSNIATAPALTVTN